MKTLQINHQRHVYGEETRFINTCLSARSMPDTTPTTGWLLAWNLLKALIGPAKYELVIIRCLGPYNSSWSFVGAGKRVFRWLMYRVALRHKAAGAKLAVLDHTDHMTIHPDDKRLLELCDVYYKRELARNAWNTLESILPEGRCIEHATEKLESYHQLKAKLKPISLGSHVPCRVIIERRRDFDFFYNGMERGIGERIQIRQVLEELEAEGHRVFLPEKPLAPEAFAKAIANTWFCPSPMGCGWDCYRHYEISIYGSIPLLSAPSISAYRPLGSHNRTAITIDYDGDLKTQLLKCLEIPIDDRVAMIERAQNHVQSHHSLPALGGYMIAETQRELA